MFSFLISNFIFLKFEETTILTQGDTLPYAVRGRLKLTTPAESISGRLVRSALAVMIRESGW